MSLYDSIMCKLFIKATKHHSNGILNFTRTFLTIRSERHRATDTRVSDSRVPKSEGERQNLSNQLTKLP